jgi:hypothetical protein
MTFGPLAHPNNDFTKIICEFPHRLIDAHRRGRGGVRSEKFDYKNALKPEKGIPPNFSQPLYTFPHKFGQNLMDPPPGFSNHVHLCLILSLTRLTAYKALILSMVLLARNSAFSLMYFTILSVSSMNTVQDRAT